MGPMQAAPRSRALSLAALSLAALPAALSVTGLAGALLVGCDGGLPDASAITSPPPGADELPDMATDIAQRLGRVSCAACPDSWTPRPCELLTELQRTDDPLQAATCSAVTVPARAPGVPEGLPARLGATLAQLEQDLGGRRRDRPHRALQLYALGTDLQRLGTVELWQLGLQARSQALVDLLELGPNRTWPRELLQIDAGAPPPARVLDVATLETLLHLRGRDPGWKARQGLADAANGARDALRASPEQRQTVVHRVSLGLAPSWQNVEDAPALGDAWATAELIRSRTAEIALRGALGVERSCPDSLQDLVPKLLPYVPTGWTLDPDLCEPVAPATEMPSSAAVDPVQPVEAGPVEGSAGPAG